jgi:hypothetical protein
MMTTTHLAATKAGQLTSSGATLSRSQQLIRTISTSFSQALSYRPITVHKFMPITGNYDESWQHAVTFQPPSIKRLFSKGLTVQSVNHKQSYDCGRVKTSFTCLPCQSEFLSVGISSVHLQPIYIKTNQTICNNIRRLTIVI